MAIINTRKRKAVRQLVTCSASIPTRMLKSSIPLRTSSSRREDLRRSMAPHRWKIIRYASRGTINPVGSIFDLAPIDAGRVFPENYRASCLSCKKLWWLVGVPIFGICDKCRANVITNNLDAERTLDAQSLDRYFLSGEDRCEDAPVEVLADYSYSGPAEERDESHTTQ